MGREREHMCVRVLSAALNEGVRDYLSDKEITFEQIIWIMSRTSLITPRGRTGQVAGGEDVCVWRVWNIDNSLDTTVFRVECASIEGKIRESKGAWSSRTF